jgi:large subunit ribosomal protein L5
MRNAERPTPSATVNGQNSGPLRAPEERELSIMAARLKEKYHKEIKQTLKKELGLDNPMAVPELDKIVINMGLGEATQNTKLLDPLVGDLMAIAGQKPVTTKA